MCTVDMFNFIILNIAAYEKTQGIRKAWKVVDSQEKLPLRLQMDLEGRSGMQGLI